MYAEFSHLASEGKGVRFTKEHARALMLQTQLRCIRLGNDSYMVSILCFARGVWKLRPGSPSFVRNSLPQCAFSQDMGCFKIKDEVASTPGVILNGFDILICLLQGRWVWQECSARVTRDVLHEENVVFEVVGDVTFSDS